MRGLKLEMTGNEIFKSSVLIGEEVELEIGDARADLAGVTPADVLRLTFWRRNHASYQMPLRAESGGIGGHQYDD